MTNAQPEQDPPRATFDALALSREVRQAIDELGFEHPTPVQLEVFEPARRGLDLVVQARTGTGKTAAFALPLLEGLVRKNQNAAQALVLCPTRELALQVCRETEKLGKYRELKTVPVYGGAPMGKQVDELAAGAQIVVGTPGRVLDHLRRGTLEPTDIRVLVLDESDEMLSMGFLPQITEILSFLPESRQTLLFSATLPPDIRRMAETKLHDAQFLTLSGDHVGALSIRHIVYRSYSDKLGDFLSALEIENPESAIVFCNTREQTKRVSAALREQGYSSDWLNADLAQADREKVLAATREGRLRFMVCTDVAARGIDISHLTHVINFDLPESSENYVHRTGRTGRAGKTGTAISMIAPSDVGGLYSLWLTYRIRAEERQVPSAGELQAQAEADLLAHLGHLFANERPSDRERSLARRVLTHELAVEIVAGLLRSQAGDALDTMQAAASDRRRRSLPPPVETEEAAAPQRARRPERSREERRPRSDERRPRNDEPRDERRPRNDEPRDERRPRNDEPRDERRPRNDEPRDERRPRNDEPRDERRPATDEGAEEQSRPASDAPKPRRERTRRTEAVRPASFEDEFRYTVEDSTDAPAPSLSAPLPRRDEESQDDQPTAGGDSRELFLNLGRRDGVRSDDVRRLLEEAGVPEDRIVSLRVRQRNTFVRLSAEDLALAVAHLHGSEYEGRAIVAEEARGRDDES